MEILKHTLPYPVSLLKTCLVWAVLCSTWNSEATPKPGSGFSAPDSLIVQDSLLNDSTLVKDSLASSGSDLDTVVVYQASDSILFSFGSKNMDLYGKSSLIYGPTHLKSERINIDWTTNQLFAEGLPDSSGKIAGNPEFIDDAEPFYGSRVYYNFKTKKGRVLTGNTEMGDGYYRGTKIKKQRADVLFVSDGVYSTCNLEEPHFHFWGKEMKILVKDKIIARPIVLMINSVPVFALPFAILPNRGGRQSGIIPPTYGESALRGLFLRGGGYYFALSDYYDFTATGDYYSKGGYNLYGDFNYNKRYDFNGSLNLGFTNEVTGEETDPDYNKATGYSILWRHNQTFDPTSNLSANVQFMSTNYLKRTSFDPRDLSKQEIQSDATYSKTFEDTDWSMNLGYRRRQTLSTGAFDQYFPSLSINKKASNPFRDETKPSSRQSWYERISVAYRGDLRGVYNKTVNEINDSTQTITRQEDYGIGHRPSLNIPFPVGSYLTLTPNFSYSEDWYFKTIRKELDPVSKKVVPRTVHEFEAARTWNAGVSASTRIYGIIQPQFGFVKGFRHVLQPSVSYNFRPDFSEPDYGYYKTVTDSSGKIQKYSIFEGSRAGSGVSSGKLSSINFSLNNIFEMKLAGKPDKDGKPAKDDVIQLLRSLNFSGGYNFAADSLNWSNLNVSASTSIGENFSIQYSSSFTPYAFSYSKNQTTGVITERITKYTLWEKDRGLFRSLYHNFSFSFNYSATPEKNNERLTYEEEQQANDPFQKTLSPAEIQKRNLKNVNFDVPWSFNLNGSYATQTPTPSVKTKSAILNGSVDISLTENWKIGAQGGYDIIREEFTFPTLSVFRDLHCWKMDFNWSPAGAYSYYSLNIHIKAPQLQDISIKKSEYSYDRF